MGLAERADLIVDFTNVPVGNHVLRNVGPDEPFGGGVPGVDFESVDPDSTGQVLQFRVVPSVAADPSTPPQFLVLPAITAFTGGTTRRLTLLEKASEFFEDSPVEALVGTVEGDPNSARAGGQRDEAAVSDRAIPARPAERVNALLPKESLRSPDFGRRIPRRSAPELVPPWQRFLQSSGGRARAAAGSRSGRRSHGQAVGQVVLIGVATMDEARRRNFCLVDG